MTRTASPFFLRLALASALVFAIATAMLRSGVGPPVARDGLARLLTAAQVAVGHATARQAPARPAAQPVTSPQAAARLTSAQRVTAPQGAAQPATPGAAAPPSGPAGGDDRAGGDDSSGHGGSGNRGPGGG